MEFAHAKKEQVYFGDFLETICIFKPTLKLAYYIRNLGKYTRVLRSVFLKRFVEES